MRERGQEAHQCFWVAAKMGETSLKSAVRKTDNTMFSVAAGTHEKEADQRVRLGDGGQRENSSHTHLNLNLSSRHQGNRKYLLADT